MFKEFRPSFLFLGKFLAIYFVFNIIYGIYVESYGSNADGITWWVSRQTTAILHTLGYEAGARPVASDPKVALLNGNDVVVNLFEGCNGINIMILFMAFIVAFSGKIRDMLWFIPAGFVFIHLANLGRIVLLYWVAETKPHYMYFTHKYLFTAIIYGAIFILWVIWVLKFSKLKLKTAK
jgi:exosortase family protein XrtF